MDANLSMEQIRKDVKNVTELNQEGYDMDVISHKLDLSKDYVQTILTCAQGFTEDDPLAVAVLVEASLLILSVAAPESVSDSFQNT